MRRNETYFICSETHYRTFIVRLANREMNKSDLNRILNIMHPNIGEWLVDVPVDDNVIMIEMPNFQHTIWPLNSFTPLLSSYDDL